MPCRYSCIVPTGRIGVNRQKCDPYDYRRKVVGLLLGVFPGAVDCLQAVRRGIKVKRKRGLAPQRPVLRSPQGGGILALGAKDLQGHRGRMPVPRPGLLKKLHGHLARVWQGHRGRANKGLTRAGCPCHEKRAFQQPQSRFPLFPEQRLAGSGCPGFTFLLSPALYSDPPFLSGLSTRTPWSGSRRSRTPRSCSSRQTRGSRGARRRAQDRGRTC